jgi:hypothetical protein
MSTKELRDAFTSTNPMERAMAYETWAGHYGWHELDNYPLSLTRAEVEKRYDADLGYKRDIESALEEETERLADISSATAWSTAGDQMEIDLEDEGYDPKSIVVFAEFGDATAVNGDLTDKTVAGIETELEADGYEYLSKFGGRLPAQEDYATADDVIQAVAHKLKMSTRDVAEVAETLDWWQEEIPHGTSGHTYVWAKKKSGMEERRRSIAERRQPQRRR